MDQLLFLLVLAVMGTTIVVGYMSGHAKDKPLWMVPMIGTLAVLVWVARHGFRLGGRGAVAGAGALASRVGLFGARRRVSDPETAEIIGRVASAPAATPPAELRKLGHGYHWTPAGVLEGVHCVILAEAGAGKGQSILNYQIQYQLQHSDEHLFILEVKRNHELSKVVAAYARPEDRIWIYSMHPADRRSSSLSLTKINELKNQAHAICNEKDTKDPHWNTKAAAVIPEVARAVTDFKGRRQYRVTDGPITATLGEIRDVIEDRETLETIRETYRNVDNVADVDKEWGYIRSNAVRHLDPLSDPRVRRVFAGGPKTPQPRFGRYPDGGRDIVILRPDESSATREERYIIGTLDVLLERALEAGYANGPGVKVLLDEFASFMDLSKMSHYLDAGRGGGLGVCYVLQGRGQLASKLGTPAEADSIIYSTEIKCIGATSDLEMAEKVAEWAGKETVDYRTARQRGQLLSEWSQQATYRVKPQEITTQAKGEWTIVHHGAVNKLRVSKQHYHYTQAAKPKPMKLRGVVRDMA